MFFGGRSMIAPTSSKENRVSRQSVDKPSGAAAPNGFPRGEAVERSETEEEIGWELWTKKTQILMSVFVQKPTF